MCTFFVSLFDNHIKITSRYPTNILQLSSGNFLIGIEDVSQKTELLHSKADLVRCVSQILSFVFLDWRGRYFPESSTLSFLPGKQSPMMYLVFPRSSKMYFSDSIICISQISSCVFLDWRGRSLHFVFLTQQTVSNSRQQSISPPGYF